jgi:hypothetical protein
VNDIDEFNGQLRKKGHWVSAAGIESPENSCVIDNRGGRGNLTEGSLFSEQDFYSGFWIIDAPDLATARDLARAGSAACNRRVELRAFL